MLPVSWRTRKANGIIQSSLKAWEMRGHWYKSQSLKAWERRAPASEGRRNWMSQLKKRERICLPLPFCSIWAPHWLMTAHIAEDASLYSASWIKCWSLPDTHLQTHLEILFYQLSEHPLAQSNWHIKINLHILLLYICFYILLYIPRALEGVRRNQEPDFINKI